MTTRSEPRTTSPAWVVASVACIGAALGLMGALLLGAAPETGLIGGAWIGLIFGLGIDELAVP